MGAWYLRPRKASSYERKRERGRVQLPIPPKDDSGQEPKRWPWGSCHGAEEWLPQMLKVGKQGRGFYLERKQKYRAPGACQEGRRVSVAGLCLGVYILGGTKLSVSHWFLPACLNWVAVLHWFLHDADFCLTNPTEECLYSYLGIFILKTLYDS